MNASEFLYWLAKRLVHVYGENENTDFVLKLKEVAKTVQNIKEKLS